MVVVVVVVAVAGLFKEEWAARGGELEAQIALHWLAGRTVPRSVR